MEPAFGEAIGLADNDFRIPGRLADAITSNASDLALDANAMATYFYPDGSPRKVGEIMTNKEYAKTLEALAVQGANALHTGPIAQAIVAKAGQTVGDDPARTPITPSLMTLQDLSNYEVKNATRFVPLTVIVTMFVRCHLHLREGSRLRKHWVF